MSARSSETNRNKQASEQTLHALYYHLLERWNDRDAAGFAALFTPDASVVGFDGSTMNGQAEIAATLQAIFADHSTATYVGIVREVRFFTAEAALLRAVAGMCPAGQEVLNPAVNTVQSLVAIQNQGAWQIALYQNTPAQFHGRPELSQQLTDELRQALLARRRPA
jgi:uncharacterized protein (TIGR02246 family)